MQSLHYALVEKQSYQTFFSNINSYKKSKNTWQLSETRKLSFEISDTKRESRYISSQTLPGTCKSLTTQNRVFPTLAVNIWASR